MPALFGYLRHYQRWDGTPGLTIAEQRALVKQMARNLEFGRSGRLFLIEQADGEANGWPILKKAIRIAQANADRGLLVVIPTLDGVQVNLSFLELLVIKDRFSDGPPIYVRSGWRRPKAFGQDTNYQRPAEWPAWLLSRPDEARAFSKMVGRVRDRSRALRRSVREGLQAASARGKKLGARNPASHRFTQPERSKGGRATAQKRRQHANEPYKKWIEDVCIWRGNGASLDQIARRLAARGVRKPDGRRIGPMLVYRILGRVMSGSSH